MKSFEQCWHVFKKYYRIVGDSLKARPKLVFLAKLSISIILLSFIIWKISISELYQSFRVFPVKYLFAAMVIDICAGFVFCLKWYLLLRHVRVKVNYLTLWGFNAIASFYVLVLPGQFSGDAVKWYKMSRKNVDSGIIGSSILMDRGIGVVVLMIVGLLALLYNKKLPLPSEVHTVAWVLLSVICIFLIIFFVVDLEEISKRIRWKIFRRMINAFALYRRSPLFLFGIGIYNIIFHIIGPLIYYPLVLGIGERISIINLVWIISLVTFLQVLPVTISGLGIREGTLVFGLGFFGIAAEKAITVSLLYFALKVVFGVFAGLTLDLFWLRRVRLASSQSFEK